MNAPKVQLTQHLLLVGLPGSGKSTVGPLVAESLGVRFFDVDAVIERSAERSVGELFAEHGEAHFRRLETEAVLTLVNHPDPAVIAPGGGWAAQPGNLQTVEGRAVCVYLETSPEIAVARASQTRGRPLLPRGLELPTMRRLLRNRERFYVLADHLVRTDRKTPTEVAREIVELARTRGAL